jgi:hypothetical protein
LAYRWLRATRRKPCDRPGITRSNETRAAGLAKRFLWDFAEHIDRAHSNITIFKGGRAAELFERNLQTARWVFGDLAAAEVTYADGTVALLLPSIVSDKLMLSPYCVKSDGTVDHDHGPIAVASRHLIERAILRLQTMMRMPVYRELAPALTALWALTYVRQTREVFAEIPTEHGLVLGRYKRWEAYAITFVEKEKFHQGQREVGTAKTKTLERRGIDCRIGKLPGKVRSLREAERRKVMLLSKP